MNELTNEPENKYKYEYDYESKYKNVLEKEIKNR